ncbi:MAG: hypothetical protein QXU11_05825 [Thermoproteota archaeon]
MVRLKIHVCSGESESWDTIWKWLWFTREVWETEYWKEEKKALKPKTNFNAALQAEG